MPKLILLAIAALIISPATQAKIRAEKYSSVANNKTGTPVYSEQHEVSFFDQRVQTAITRYLDPNGQLIGEMKSDFSKMITIPDYEYTDHRSKTSHGIKLNGDKIVLWTKSKDGKLGEAEFSKDKFSKDTLIVGCQGLHYYLIDNLQTVKEKKTIPIAYFIPGKLDYYKFSLKLDREDEQYIYLKLSIDNFLLKLFTSSLDLKYSKSDRRLVQFSGLSNITDDQNQMQNVVINYKYD